MKSNRTCPNNLSRKPRKMYKNAQKSTHQQTIEDGGLGGHNGHQRFCSGYPFHLRMLFPRLPVLLTQKMYYNLEQRCSSRHKPHAGRQNWPWPSNSSERGTKHVFYVNLAQIRSAISDIFQTQTKNTQTDGAKNRTFHSSLRAVIKPWFRVKIKLF